MKLQGKIFLFLTLVIVALALAIGWVAYAHLRGSLEQETFQQAAALLDYVEQQTNQRIATAEANAQVFAGSDLLRRYLLIEDEGERYELLQYPLLQLMAGYQRAYPDYYELRVILPDGYEDTRLSNPPLVNQNEEEGASDYFKALRQAPDDVFTDVYHNADNQQTALFIAKAVRLVSRFENPVLAKPRLRGYFAITMSLDFLTRQVEQGQIGRGGYLFITDNAGSVLFHPRNQRYDLEPRLFSALRGQIGQRAMASMMFGGAPAYVRGRELHDDLLLFAVLPQAGLEAIMGELALSVAGVTLIVILLATLALFAVLRSLVINPVKQLRRAALDIGSGQFGLSAQLGQRICRSDEIGDLAQAFQAMSEGLRRSNEQIHQLAYRDSLTGLPNRRLVLNAAARAIEKVRPGSAVALLFLDLDDFKRINDTLGHEAGDVLLCEVAGRLSSCVGVSRSDSMINNNLALYGRRQGDIGTTDGDMVARLGGDEFVVLLHAVRDANQCVRLAERIIAALAQPIIINQQPFHIGTSIGITLCPQDADSVDSLVKNADIAMYAAKQRGKNTYRLYNAELTQTTLAHVELENALHQALEQDQLELYYQPQVHSYTGELVGVEALIRWHHPERGLLSPGEFMPLAEQSSLIGPLSEWVLKRACRQASDWQRQGLPPFKMAVNISNRQFRRHDLALVVLEALEESGLPPRLLELELTETSIMEVTPEALDTLRLIKASGVTVAMDDFGTGYSSLGVLRELPIDKLKIDRSFVRDIERDGNDAAIVSAIIAMSHSLKLGIVAEGVESAAQLKFLRNKDCTLIQGYLISRPCPAAEIEQLLLELAVMPWEQRFQVA